MKIIPAIDIQKSKVVRLFKGKFDKNKIYSDFPSDIAKKWETQGAKYLHVIDLDGADEGRIKNEDTIKTITESCSLKVQVGGGIRDRVTIENLLSIGVNKVILGTMVKEKFNMFLDLMKDYKENIIVAIDTKNSKIVSRGWKASSNMDYITFAKRLEDNGVDTIIFTDTLRDGTLTSPNFESIEELLDATNISVIASGGVANIKHVKNLYNLHNKKLEGIIIGKALYENKLSLKKCVEKFED